MFIIINTVFVFVNINLEAVTSLCAIIYACALFLVLLVALCDVKENLLHLNAIFSAELHFLDL